jgi:hypothetical protein
LAAFNLGVYEGNPLLAWFADFGLFIHAKITLTALAATLIALLYSLAPVRPIVHLAIFVMALVDVYHVWALSALLSGG